MQDLTLKKLDSNCSDCQNLERDLAAKQHSEDFHFRVQKELFDKKRIKRLGKHHQMIEKSKDVDRYRLKDRIEYKEKAKVLLKEIRSLKFEFDSSPCSIGYGYCLKLDKLVQFIPNIYQFETQECFKRREVKTKGI